MNVLHFVDAAGTDEHFVPARNINLIEVTAATTVKIWWSTSESDVDDDLATITVTSGHSDECARALASLLVDERVGTSSVTTIQATTPFKSFNNFDGGEISAVAYTAGT